MTPKTIKIIAKQPIKNQFLWPSLFHIYKRRSDKRNGKKREKKL